MADVFISAAPEDGPAAHFLADQFQAAGYTAVVGAPGGPADVAASGTTVALWSPRSAARTDLLHIATEALQQGRLVSAGMENMSPLTAIGGEPWVDLTGWTGNTAAAPWRLLIDQVSRRVMLSRQPEAPMAPPPAPPIYTPPPEAPAPTPSFDAAAPPVFDAPPPPAFEPPPAYEQPRAYPPPPPPPPGYATASPYPAPDRGGPPAGALLAGGLAFVLVLAAGGAGWWWWQSNQAATEIAEAWKDVDEDDPAKLRAFIKDHPRSRQAEEAEATLERLENRRFEEASAARDRTKLQDFIDDFPDSSRRQRARDLMSEIDGQTNAARAGGEARPLAPSPPSFDPSGQGGFGPTPGPTPPMATPAQPSTPRDGPISIRPPSTPVAPPPIPPAPPPPPPPPPPLPSSNFEDMLTRGQQDPRIQPVR